MKKLMIAAAIVCAAAIAQAEAITWSTGTMYFDGKDSALNDSSGTKLDSGTAYIFSLTAQQYGLLTTAADIWSAAGE